MINQKESELVKKKFLQKLEYYIKKDEQERNLILRLMVCCFLVALIFTAISSLMLYMSFKTSEEKNISHPVSIVEGDVQNE